MSSSSFHFQTLLLEKLVKLLLMILGFLSLPIGWIYGEPQETPQSSQSSKTPPAQMEGFEFKRTGKQLNVRLLLDRVPEYEVRSNLKRKILAIRLKNSVFHFPDGKSDRFFNDSLLQGARLIQEGPHLWIQFKARVAGLDYQIEPSKNGLIIQFRPTIKVPSIPPPPPPPAYQLLSIKLAQQPPSFSRMTLFVSSKNRLLLVPNEEGTEFTVRFLDTRPALDFKTPQYQDPWIQFSAVIVKDTRTQVVVKSNTGKLTVQKKFEEDPPRWVFDFYGEPSSQASAVGKKKRFSFRRPSL